MIVPLSSTGCNKLPTRRIGALGIPQVHPILFSLGAISSWNASRSTDYTKPQQFKNGKKPPSYVLLYPAQAPSQFSHVYSPRNPYVCYNALAQIQFLHS